MFIARGCIASTELQRLCGKLYLPLVVWASHAVSPFLWRPTFKHALPHFLRFVAKPAAVGEIQRQTGFRQGILYLLVIRHKRGGALHVVKNLEGEEEIHLRSSSRSAPKWSEAAAL